MKINRTTFWVFSIVVSILSCYLFYTSSVQVYSDSERMESLQLSPNADTAAIPIAGSAILSFAAIAAHVILLLLFLIIAYKNHKDIFINRTDFILNFKKNKGGKIVIQLFAYTVTIYWIWDFIDTTRTNFFFSLLFFAIVAVVVTWIYVLWIINLTRKNSNKNTNKEQKTFIIGCMT